MHRLYTLAVALAVFGAVMAHHGSAETQEQKKHEKQAKPPQPPKVILRDRWLYGPPPQPEPKYYGPAPTIQPPMERVPPPAPLSEPPINR
jgi:hypothetical protein